MSRSQRVTLLGIGAAIAVAAVVVLLVAGGGSGQTAPTGTGSVPLLTQGGVRKLTSRQGDQVRFRVRSDADDQVHVHGYNIERALKAGQPQTIAFRATINGVFEIELHHANVQIGQLTVEPR